MVPPVDENSVASRSSWKVTAPRIKRGCLMAPAEFSGPAVQQGKCREEDAQGGLSLYLWQAREAGKLSFLDMVWNTGYSVSKPRKRS
jgi:hypothetical protein